MVKEFEVGKYYKIKFKTKEEAEKSWDHFNEDMLNGTIGKVVKCLKVLGVIYSSSGEKRQEVVFENIGKYSEYYYWLPEHFEEVKEGKVVKQQHPKYLVITESCQNLNLANDLNNIKEDSKVYLLKPFLRISKKTILRREKMR